MSKFNGPLHIGPYDLSGSLGHPGELDHPSLSKALKKVKSACARAGTTMGYHAVDPDPLKTKNLIKNGYKFIADSADFLLLSGAVQYGIANIKKDTII